MPFQILQPWASSGVSQGESNSHPLNRYLVRLMIQIECSKLQDHPPYTLYRMALKEFTTGCLT